MIPATFCPKRSVLGCRVPDDQGINSEIRVDDKVTESNNIRPFDVRIAFSKWCAEMRRRLTDDLQATDDRVPEHVIGKELVEGSILHVAAEHLYALNDIPQVELLPPGHK
jgi:hypothetical protein